MNQVLMGGQMAFYVLLYKVILRSQQLFINRFKAMYSAQLQGISQFYHCKPKKRYSLVNGKLESNALSLLVENRPDCRNWDNQSVSVFFFFCTDSPSVIGFLSTTLVHPSCKELRWTANSRLIFLEFYVRAEMYKLRKSIVK